MSKNYTNEEKEMRRTSNEENQSIIEKSPMVSTKKRGSKLTKQESIKPIANDGIKHCDVSMKSTEAEDKKSINIQDKIDHTQSTLNELMNVSKTTKGRQVVRTGRGSKIGEKTEKEKREEAGYFSKKVNRVKTYAHNEVKTSGSGTFTETIKYKDELNYSTEEKIAKPENVHLLKEVVETISHPNDLVVEIPFSSKVEGGVQEVEGNLDLLNINTSKGVYVPPHLKDQNRAVSTSTSTRGRSSQYRQETRRSNWSGYSNISTYEEERYDEPLHNEAVYYRQETLNNDKDFSQIRCNVKISPLLSFDELKLPRNLHEHLVSLTPTPIQSFAIPAILKNRDVICRAPTGVGKTISFLVPLILKLERRVKPCLRVLILTPTRELALQIENELEKLLTQKRNIDNGSGISANSYLRGVSLYGGTDINFSRSKMALGCDILIATPGRLCDFIEKKYVNLKNIKFFVLDEADRMLEMGFEKEMNYIRNCLNTPLTYMFSATFDRRVKCVANSYLNSQISIEYEQETLKNITQEFVLDSRSKDETLFSIIKANKTDRILIFVETKVCCRSLENTLKEYYDCVSLHGDKTQPEREFALNKFSTGKCNILVATSVAARGLDIPLINLVINYDLPRDIKEYIHRIGRSGRCGKDGWSISIYNPSRNGDLRNDIIDVLKESGNKIPGFLLRR